MFILFIVVAAAMLLCLGKLVAPKLVLLNNTNRSAFLAVERIKNLSQVSQELVKEYKSIPEESRPVPDIYSVVKALDDKFVDDAQARNEHFSDLNWGRNRQGYRVHEKRFTWNKYHCGNSNNSNCEYSAYHRLHNAFVEVNKANAKKEKALRESRLKPDLDMVDEIVTRLRDETAIQYKMAKEFKELS